MKRSVSTALFLCVMMVISLVPAAALAAPDMPASSATGGLRYTVSVAKFENRAGWRGQWDIGDGWGIIMTDILNQRAEKSLRDNSFIAIVDGEIVPYGQIKYGRDYTLGDIVELAGHSGVVQNARVTEYIRSHDGSGETAYPTVSIVS